MPRNSGLQISTDREVQAARAKGERAEYRIKGARNLVLRVTRGGSKSWTFLYPCPTSGRRSKLALGTYPSMTLAAAKDTSLALTVAVRGGSDPLVFRRASEDAETFAALCNRYLVEHERRNARGGRRGKWTREAERLLRANVLPAIGHHRAEAVTRQHVADVVEAVAARGAYVSSDHVLGLIRAIYNWGNGTGAVAVDPTRGLTKRNMAKRRERVLTGTEVRAFWLALDQAAKLSPAIRTALKLELLLGVRISEALNAERAELDLDAGVWTIPSRRTKSNRAHALPLPSLALSLLRDADEAAGEGGLLFPSEDGRAVRAKSAMRAVLRIRQRIGVDDIGSHDLRRTLATGLGHLGVLDEIIERVLNHAPRTVTTRHYNHATYQRPMREALDAWQERVVGMLWGLQ